MEGCTGVLRALGLLLRTPCTFVPEHLTISLSPHHAQGSRAGGRGFSSRLYAPALQKVIRDFPELASHGLGRPARLTKASLGINISMQAGWPVGTSACHVLLRLLQPSQELVTVPGPEEPRDRNMP